MGKVFRTPTYKSDIRKIYAHSLRRFGEKVADATMLQMKQVEQAALKDPSYGKLDTQYHSTIFRYKTIRNSQTLFFHRLGNDVVMITAGSCRRDWRVILNDLEAEIMQHIKNILAQE